MTKSLTWTKLPRARVDAAYQLLVQLFADQILDELASQRVRIQRRG